MAHNMFGSRNYVTTEREITQPTPDRDRADSDLRESTNEINRTSPDELLEAESNNTSGASPSAPPLQREAKKQVDNVTNSLDGYDSETMVRLSKKIDTSVEDVRNYAVKYIEKRLKEFDTEMDNKIQMNDKGIKSEIAENVSMIANLQHELDNILEKVRASQAEILMVNKNLAASMKNQKFEL